MSITLHSYQAAAYDGIFGEFARGRRSTMVAMPCGTGKTIVFGSVARKVVEDGGKALILAHRYELISQAVNSLVALGLDPSVEMAEEAARGSLWGDSACVVASVPTMQGRRLASWPRDYFDLIVTDECQHAPCDSNRAIYDHFRFKWHLGVTANAASDRMDGVNLGEIYESVAHEITLRRAITEGWLCRLQAIRCKTKADLSRTRTTGTDLNEADVVAAIAPHIAELAKSYRAEAENRRGIVFTRDVGAASAFASALRSMGEAAESVHGDHPDRDAIIDRFRRGRTKHLCNNDLLTEGADFPFVGVLGLARPTQSRGLANQMIGRGTRLSHSTGKTNCKLVDFAWLTGQHKLVTAVDLIAGPGFDPEARSEVESLFDDGESLDLMSAIERGESKAIERRKYEVKVRDTSVSYGRTAFDPVGIGDDVKIPVRAVKSDPSLKDRASDKQVKLLAKFGVPRPDTLTRARAGQILGHLIPRAVAGKSTFKQVMHLKRFGVDVEAAKAMSLKEASDAISAIKRGGLRCVAS